MKELELLISHSIPCRHTYIFRTLGIIPFSWIYQTLYKALQKFPGFLVTTAKLKCYDIGPIFQTISQHKTNGNYSALTTFNWSIWRAELHELKRRERDFPLRECVIGQIMELGGLVLALLLSYLFNFSQISLKFGSFLIIKEGVGLDQGFNWVPRNGIRRSMNP